MKKDWLVFMVKPSNGDTPGNHFDSLLNCLKTQEEILEKLEPLDIDERPVVIRKNEKNYAFTRPTRKGRGCVICGDKRHKEKIFCCK